MQTRYINFFQWHGPRNRSKFNCASQQTQIKFVQDFGFALESTRQKRFFNTFCFKKFNVLRMSSEEGQIWDKKSSFLTHPFSKSWELALLERPLGAILFHIPIKNQSGQVHITKSNWTWDFVRLRIQINMNDKFHSQNCIGDRDVYCYK